MDPDVIFAISFADSSYYNFYHYEFGEIVTICLLHYPKCSDKMALQRFCEILITLCECVMKNSRCLNELRVMRKLLHTGDTG